MSKPAEGPMCSVAIRKALPRILIIFLMVCWGGGRLWAQNAASAPKDQAAARAEASRRLVRRKATADKKLEAESLAASEQEAAQGKAARSPVATLNDGLLKVEGNGAPLDRIVSVISAIADIQVQGQAGDSETYGTYGPASPATVLTNLLAGSNQNVVMLGVNSRGAPQKLILTPRSGDASPPSATSAAQPAEPQYADAEPLGPGAIANSPPPPPEDPDVRMQQNLDRLQKMQDEQKQGEPSQQPR